jgi:hypothetical protein
MGRLYSLVLFVNVAVGNQILAHCPFCGMSGQTLSQEAASASLVLYGTPKNAKLDPKDFAQGTTELEIEAVIKPHKILGDRKIIILQKYLPQPDPKNPQKLLVFCDIYKNELDSYRGTPFGSNVVTYLQGAIALKDKSIGDRLRFFFNYLNDPDVSIATDALMEFGNADYKDMRPVAEKLDAKLIAGWLRDPGLALSRLGLFSSILGHCGKPEDAKLLKDILEDPKRKYSGGVDGVLAGFIMLVPTEGWKYLTELVNDSKKDFLLRHAALRTARFFWEYRPDIIDRKQIADTAAGMIDQPDITDMVIEDMRKWAYWAPASRILTLLKKKEFDTLLIRRAIVRYMLCCPASECPEAAAFIAGERKRDKQYVDDIDSLLRQESGGKPVQPKPPDGK